MRNRSESVHAGECALVQAYGGENEIKVVFVVNIDDYMGVSRV